MRRGLKWLKAHAKESECPFCGDPRKANPTGRKSLTCGDEVCITAYHHYYSLDRRKSCVRRVVEKLYRPSRGLGMAHKDVWYADRLECGHIWELGTRRDETETRRCKQCLIER